ncbi:MAG: VOC family protein [Siculibacillus sp.]|nr:VOC family protein [Siculibacillus sp.]
MAVPGTIVWNELATSDLEGTKAFYAAAFGWTYEEIATPAGPYTLARVPGQTRPVAGLLQWPKGEDGSDMWFTYVDVADIEATVATVAAAGGRANPIFEVPGVGRMATIVDPNGTTLALKQRDSVA